MLKNILSPQICKTCKICCNYTSKSLWDIPGFTLDEYKNVIAHYPEFKSQCYRKNNLYYFKPIQISNDMYLCPFLRNDGCSLGKDKPFKCAIWPLYVVNYESKVFLSISNVCPNIIEITPNILENELQTSIEKIEQTVRLHPELIEIYRDHFTLLTQLNT